MTWSRASKAATCARSTAPSGSRRTWPAESRGYGFMDAPRGALGHWVRIKDGKIANYQCVVPSTWNCSPRDGQGQPGPYEASLVDNHPLVDPERPLEILRTIHSFDPCMACGVHVIDATGKTVARGDVSNDHLGRTAGSTFASCMRCSTRSSAHRGNYRWVYLWHWPIRAMHWAAVAALIDPRTRWHRVRDRPSVLLSAGTGLGRLLHGLDALPALHRCRRSRRHRHRQGVLADRGQQVSSASRRSSPSADAIG